MAQWYYFSETGEKVGPMSDNAFKSLVQNGTIKRTTIIANQFGRTVQAGNIPGLPFPRVQPGSPQPGGGPGGPFGSGMAPHSSASPTVPAQSAKTNSGEEDSSSKWGLLIAAAVFLIGAAAAGYIIYTHEHKAEVASASAQSANQQENAPQGNDNQQGDNQNQGGTHENNQGQSAADSSQSAVPEPDTAPAPTAAPAFGARPLSELRAEQDELQIILEDTEFWLKEYAEYAEQKEMVKKDPYALE